MQINCEIQALAAWIPEKELPLHNRKQAARVLDPVSASREARKFHVTSLNLTANIQSKITLPPSYPILAKYFLKTAILVALFQNAET
jgi:hypothetical protein